MDQTWTKAPSLEAERGPRGISSAWEEVPQHERAKLLGVSLGLGSGSAAVWEDEAAQDDQVVRIDPTTLAIAERFHVGGNVSAVAFGFKSLWAALQTGQVVLITPKPSA